MPEAPPLCHYSGGVLSCFVLIVCCLAVRGWVLFHLLCLLFVFTRLFAGAVCFRLRSLVCTFSAVVVVLLLVLFVLLVCARLFAVCLVLRVFVCVVSAFIVFFL